MHTFSVLEIENVESRMVGTIATDFPLVVAPVEDNYGQWRSGRVLSLLNDWGDAPCIRKDLAHRAHSSGLFDRVVDIAHSSEDSRR